MAHYHILEEVRTGESGDWQLCFQYGIYEYDSSEPDPREFGYRFIWRRPNGQLQGARGQARLEPELIQILLGRAAAARWYPTPPHTRGRSARIDGAVWRISIQPPVTARWVAEGDYIPQSQEGGLHFFSDHGTLFLPLDDSEGLPSATELALASQEQLRAWLSRVQETSAARR